MVFNRRQRNQFGRALVNAAGNPVAQLARFAHIPSNTRPYSSQSNFPSSTTMPRGQVSDDEDMGDSGEDMAIGMAVAGALSAEPGKRGGVVQETKITRQPHHYGLPNTVTAVHPHVWYYSMVVDLSPAAIAQRLTFQPNTMYDVFNVALTTPTASAAFTPDVYNRPIPNSTATAWPATLPVFPRTSSNGINECGQFRDWYDQMYQYYVVLGCEYTITFVNQQRNLGADVVVGTYADSYTSANGTSVHPNNQSVEAMHYWPDIDNLTLCKASGDNSSSENYAVIKGRWTPGSIHKNVENDEDLKTWTKANASPALTEEITIFGGSSWNAQYAAHHGVNVRVELRQITQWKDLRPQFRWPAVGQTPIALTAPTDIFSLS